MDIVFLTGGSRQPSYLSRLYTTPLLVSYNSDRPLNMKEASSREEGAITSVALDETLKLSPCAV